jgi:PAS domain S-box-containing protein
LSVRQEPYSGKVTKRGIFGSRREEVIETLYNQVRELENRYKKLYEGSPSMYRTIDIHGFIIDCNQAYVDTLGYSSKNEVIGHSLFEHVAPESMEAMHNSFKEWQLCGTVKNKEIVLKRKDNSTFAALLNATSLYDDNNNLVGSNTAIIDMTETQRTRQQLQDAFEQLKEAQKLKEDFIRIAAHDLRTPIQPILIMAEMAKSNPAHLDEALTIIVREAKRLKNLADNLLDLAKIENGSLSYDLRKFRINEILNEIIENGRVCMLGDTNGTRDQGIFNPVRIVADFDQDIELHLDKNRMIQALSNLIGNSIKFTKEGQITLQTRILAEKGLFEIRIADTGEGIPPEILPKLFERFASKGPTNRSSNQNGTGLGLFITRSIIRAHGGFIISSNNSRCSGATFVVTIPIVN